MTNPQKYLIYIAYAGFIATAMVSGALNVAWLQIQGEFGLPLSAIGILLTLPVILSLGISFYSGQLIAWLGMGRFLLVGSVLSAIGLVGIALSPLWTMLVIFQMVMGAGNSVLINGLNIFVASNYASSRMNWLHASFGLGATMGPILITIVALDMGMTWRVGYVVMAVVMGAFVMMLLLTLKHWLLPSSERDEKLKNDAESAPMKSVFSLPVVWFGIGIMFLSAGVETSTGQLSNSLFVDGRGYDPRMIGTWLSLYWFSYTVGRFITGMVIDRVSHNLFLRVSMLGTIIGTTLMWLDLSLVANFVGLVVIGLTMAPVAPTVMGDTPQRVGVLRSPNVIGYQNVGAGLGIAFFPSMAGIFGELVSLEVIPLMLVMIAIVMFVVHELLNFQEKREALNVAIK